MALSWWVAPATLSLTSGHGGDVPSASTNWTFPDATWARARIPIQSGSTSGSSMWRAARRPNCWGRHASVVASTVIGLRRRPREDLAVALPPLPRRTDHVLERSPLRAPAKDVRRALRRGDEDGWIAWPSRPD